MPIFDQGYQHWNGELSGHTWRCLAITRHGVRVGMKNRFIRMAMIVSWLPAILLVVFLCLWGLIERKSDTVSTLIQFMSFLSPGIVSDPVHYRVDIWRLAYGYFLQIELWFSMILILLVGPSLISQDLRFNAFPLYFSRPLRRIDYFLGKLGIIVAFLGLVMILPALVAYILGMFFSLDITIIRDTFPILLASITYGLIVALSAGLFVLALSALSRNSRYIGLVWFGIFFLSFVTSAMLQGIDSQQRRHAYFNQISTPRPAVQNWSKLTEEEEKKQMDEWQTARRKMDEQFRLAELNFSKTDWRPLVSYTANLSRLKQQLLHTNETWQELSLFQPSSQDRERLLIDHLGPQYPWYWSAFVLIGLFGISACILNLSVKSLDRLK